MLIDAHAHLDSYQENLDSALKEIAEGEILTISNSMDPLSYKRSLEIAARCDYVLPTFGVHPRRAPRYADRLKSLDEFIEQSPMLGEWGLDYHWVQDASQYEAQRKVFEYCLAAAREQNKVLNLHTKGAEREILGLLKAHGIERAIIHWYSGPLELLRELVALGFHFTVGVEIFQSAHIQAIAGELPASQLLTETDNPGGQKWLTGSVGMPSLLRGVVEKIAAIRETDASSVKRQVETNFARLLRKDPWLSPLRDRFFSQKTEDVA